MGAKVALYQLQVRIVGWHTLQTRGLERTRVFTADMSNKVKIKLAGCPGVGKWFARGAPMSLIVGRKQCWNPQLVFDTGRACQLLLAGMVEYSRRMTDGGWLMAGRVGMVT